MRKLFYSLLGFIVTRLIMATMRKSRPPAMDRRVEELKNKFRPLDTV
jgi:hypothetical protein